MKNPIRQAILPLLLTVCLLPSCQQPKEYRNDRSCEELVAAAIDAVPVEYGYETLDGSALSDRFDAVEGADGACLQYSILSEDLNEIGVLHAPTEQAARALYDDCEDYLEELIEEKSAFIASYAPEELPKLEHAEVRQFGSYTVYAILSDEDRARAFAAIEQALTP